MGSHNSIRSGLVDFDRNFLDPQTPLSCVGAGMIGGKAEGLVGIRARLHAGLSLDRLQGVSVEIPPMLVLCTDIFDLFIQNNNLAPLISDPPSDDRIARAFQNAQLPFEVLGDLRSVVEQVHTPLAIRSSSLLEDTRRSPFAGIYHTKMIPNSEYDPDIRFRQLVEAIKFVYASTYFKSARDYRRTIGSRDQDEKMAVIIQELVGKRYHDRFYPELAGVARSYNYYPMRPARPEDGVVNLALGLGKTVVDGGISWPYSPAYPQAVPPFGSDADMLKSTQTEFWVVNMGEPPAYDPQNEMEYIRQENLLAAEQDGSLPYLASTYNALSGRLSIGVDSFKGPRVLTFAPLLVLKQVPFNDLVKSLLAMCEDELGAPVEIEFAMTFNPHRFGFVQVRAMEIPSESLQVEERELVGEKVLVASLNVLGNGVVENIRDVVYIRPQSFELRHSPAIVPELEAVNSQLLEAGLPYALVVFGRLGTSDPWLGIPVQWGQVCGARVIVEATQENARVELSQGSHYFHNMINLGVKYFSIPFSSQYAIAWDSLEQQEVIWQGNFVRHVRFPAPLKIRVDGRRSRGVIIRP